MTATLCPACDAGVVVDGATLPNEIVECGECRSELEVVTTEPVLLALAPEVEEDWGE
ncbi:lysine biosynthesis protein LysW [Actinosynnema sp. NPDC050436]|uniref:lysine biosynthesis protein LysW n=1 Tax=Actinosynnema sp. NPDC050436 TaxID=3155659 RepID=UPI0033E4DE9E